MMDIIYVMYVFFRVFSIGCSTTYSWYLGILKIKVGVGWWLWKSIDRYLPMFFQFNPAIHGHRVTNLPSPKTLQQWVYESIHVWIVLYARITYTNIVQRYVLFLAKKRTIFSKLPVLDTHTHTKTHTTVPVPGASTGDACATHRASYWDSFGFWGVVGIGGFVCWFCEAFFLFGLLEVWLYNC